MDKLNTALNGGFPLELDDLRWQAVGIDRAFEGLCAGIGDCILTGIVATPDGGGTFTVTRGFCILNGEVREYPGGTFVDLLGDPANMALVALDDLDPIGVETFEDLTSQNAYVRRRMNHAPAVFVPSATINMATGPRLGERLRDLAGLGLAGPWRKIGDPGEPTFQNGYTGGTGDEAVAFRLEPNGIVRLRGTLHASGVGATNLAAFTLPATFRPAAGAVVSGPLLTPSLTSPVDDTRMAYVTSGGDFVVYLPTGSPAVVTDRFNLLGFPTYLAVL